MPTHEELPSFLHDFDRLSPTEQRLFLAAVQDFTADLHAWERGDVGQPHFRSGLRVKDLKGFSGLWEMTWSWPNGRATFEYGPPVADDKVHIIWRRVGGHEIFRNP